MECKITRLVNLFLICTCIFAQQSLAQKGNLPHTFTDKERDVWDVYQAARPGRGISSPPPETVRTMAEWEELQGILITWASHHDILGQIIEYAQTECQVFIVCSDSNQVKNYLTIRGVPLFNLNFLLEEYDSIWCRDYGPWTIYLQESGDLSFTDWIYNRPRPDDDLIPDALGAFLDVPVYSTVEEPYSLVNTGGNFMTDGQGNAFASKLVLEENPDKTESEIDDIMVDFMGIERYIKMDVLPYDDIHHIDMHMKLLDEETLLVGEYPEGVADGPQIEANLDYIVDNFNTCYGRPYRVVRIPMPPDALGRYPDSGGDYRTYTNSVIVNKTVIVPFYEEQYDTTAQRIYEEAMPGYRIVGIDCNDIITSLGAIHCITKEIGTFNPIHIAHAKLDYVLESDPEYEITAKISSADGIDSAYTYWSADTSSEYHKLQMQAIGNDSFQTAIPAHIAGTRLFYYIKAYSAADKSIAKPFVAPDGVYDFLVEGTSNLIEQHAAHYPNIYDLRNFPNPFNSATTITWISESTKPIQFNCYDITGRLVFSADLGKAHKGLNRLQLDFNSINGSLSSGIYIGKITGNAECHNIKLVYTK